MKKEPYREIGTGLQSIQKRDRKFWTAMALFGVLAVVIWFTFGDGKAVVFGKTVQLRWIPLLVVATFVFRTYIAREADKIRHHVGDANDEFL